MPYSITRKPWNPLLQTMPIFQACWIILEIHIYPAFTILRIYRISMMPYLTTRKLYGNSYLYCFKHTGDLQDINCAILHYQKAVDFSSSGHIHFTGLILQVCYTILEIHIQLISNQPMIPLISNRVFLFIAKVLRQMALHPIVWVLPKMQLFNLQFMIDLNAGMTLL